MTDIPALSHSVTALIEAPAELTFAFLADPLKVGNWALASMQAEPADDPGIYRGRSLFDGAQNHFAVTRSSAAAARRIQRRSARGAQAAHPRTGDAP